MSHVSSVQCCRHARIAFDPWSIGGVDLGWLEASSRGRRTETRSDSMTARRKDRRGIEKDEEVRMGKICSTRQEVRNRSDVSATSSGEPERRRINKRRGRSKTVRMTIALEQIRLKGQDRKVLSNHSLEATRTKQKA